MIVVRKLSKEEVRELVIRIRQGEGDDKEFTEWMESISFSTANPEVRKCIISGRNATIDEIMDKLYSYKPILL